MVISWGPVSREEAEEFTQAYLAAQEAYYEEHMDDCCGTCEHYENGKCCLNISELVEPDSWCRWHVRLEVSTDE